MSAIDVIIGMILPGARRNGLRMLIDANG